MSFSRERPDKFTIETRRGSLGPALKATMLRKLATGFTENRAERRERLAAERRGRK